MQQHISFQTNISKEIYIVTKENKVYPHKLMSFVIKKKKIKFRQRCLQTFVLKQVTTKCKPTHLNK